MATHQKIHPIPLFTKQQTLDIILEDGDNGDNEKVGEINKITIYGLFSYIVKALPVGEEFDIPTIICYDGKINIKDKSTARIVVCKEGEMYTGRITKKPRNENINDLFPYIIKLREETKEILESNISSSIRNRYLGIPKEVYEEINKSSSKNSKRFIRYKDVYYLIVR